MITIEKVKAKVAELEKEKVELSSNRPFDLNLAAANIQKMKELSAQIAVLNELLGDG